MIGYIGNVQVDLSGGLIDDAFKAGRKVKKKAEGLVETGQSLVDRGEQAARDAATSARRKVEEERRAAEQWAREQAKRAEDTARGFVPSIPYGEGAPPPSAQADVKWYESKWVVGAGVVVGGLILLRILRPKPRQNRRKW